MWPPLSCIRETCNTTESMLCGDEPSLTDSMNGSNPVTDDVGPWRCIAIRAHLQGECCPTIGTQCAGWAFS